MIQQVTLCVYDSEIGAPDSSGVKVTLSEPVVKGTDSVVIPENPVEVPAINYESEIKPEDLPF